MLSEKNLVCTQDTQLFGGTVRDNLLFVQPNASDKEIREHSEKRHLPRFCNVQ